MIANNIKAELWKTLHNRLFWLAIIIGIVIMSVNVFENVQRMSTYGYATSGLSGNYCGLSLFIGLPSMEQVWDSAFYILYGQS